MGRPNFFRQRILTQAASLESKGLFSYLVSEIKARREISLEEAILVARDSYEFLDRELLKLAPGQLVFPAIEGKTNYQKRSRLHQQEKMVTLTVIDEEDVELMAEFGIVAMQRNRLARIIEEAYSQDAILDGSRLLLFILESHLGIRSHLKHLWNQGVILPVATMNKDYRQLMKEFRSVIAIRRYIEGSDLLEIRKDLAISSSYWQKLFNWFKEVGAEGIDLDGLSEKTGQPIEVLKSWQNLWEQYRDVLDSRVVIEEQPKGGLRPFYQLLRERHGYSVAAAEQFIDDLHDIANHINRQDRSRSQIIYNAVSDEEPAGKKLNDCRLKAVVLDYIAEEDFELADRESPAKLKWARLLRFSTQARHQGTVLTQPDLSLLLGISTKAIQSMLKNNADVFVPTRGSVVDMGPTLSHANKIIDLFMNGYTETEIVQRTGHSYSSIERYILDYARVVCLIEKGMPAPVIRKVLGFSRKLVDKYIALYEEYSGPDYAFMYGKIRRLAEAHPVKKKEKEE